MIRKRAGLFGSSLSSKDGVWNVARSALLSCGFLVFCVGIVFIVRASSSANNDQPITEEKAVSLAAVAATSLRPSTNPSRVETEIVTIRLDGFEPKQISRPQGKFILVVDNRSGVDAVSLSLSVDSGQLLHQVTVPKETLDWAQGLDLPPGRYLLRETNTADWVCELTITS
jgi:hypothetical protein